MTFPTVLDVTAGGRMMWHDLGDDRAIFCDIRQENRTLCDGREIKVQPTIVSDFRALPFPNGMFYHVVFDPPHLERLGATSWNHAKYGVLFPTWREDIAQGFSECFRVLRPGGTLIFKWNENQIPIREILALTPHKPLYGHRSGKRSKTHWISFIKETG